MLILFTVTIFTSAFLVFLIQPMFARMALPLLGGAPAVWNTALVFYQAVLLGGYAYAHEAAARMGSRRQCGLHIALMLLPFLVLPIGLPSGWKPPAHADPALWLLGLMAVAVGLPFFMVSAEARFCRDGLPMRSTSIHQTHTFFTLPATLAACWRSLHILH